MFLMACAFQVEGDGEEMGEEELGVEESALTVPIVSLTFPQSYVCLGKTMTGRLGMWTFPSVNSMTLTVASGGNAMAIVPPAAFLFTRSNYRDLGYNVVVKGDAVSAGVNVVVSATGFGAVKTVPLTVKVCP